MKKLILTNKRQLSKILLFRYFEEYGGDLGYQSAKIHFQGIRGLKKAGNIGNRVTGASQISKYPVFEHKI